MKLELENRNYRFITDNSCECDSESAFVKTYQNKKFINQAKKCCCIIELEDLFKTFGIDKIKIIGITGTNGKTTTSSLIYSLLLDLGYKVALQGTRGFFINDKKIYNYTLTTPSILETYKHIYQAISENVEFFIMEVSSHAISQNRIESLPFALRVHTNITQDHLDYHKTIENYRKVKNSFFNNNDLKLINSDDKFIDTPPFRSYTYSLEKGSSFKLLAYSLTNGLSGMVQYLNEVGEFFSELHGIFNLYNILGAVGSVKLLTDKPLQEICNVVENFIGIAGRMEIVNQNPLIIVDFAHTPDGMKQVFNSFKDKNIKVVFGAGGDRDRDKRHLMGAVAEQFAKKIYLTSDNPRFENPETIVKDILQGVKNREKVKVILNRRDAIKLAISELKSDEVLLILGKGDENFQIIYDKKFPFNDKKVVQNGK
jgi:UDP-N-acetylmuramoyl-L-alanyl-D-glutamate--2,6-diaminopimelate ligase